MTGGDRGATGGAWPPLARLVTRESTRTDNED